MNSDNKEINNRDKIKVVASSSIEMNEERRKGYELAEYYMKKYKKAMEVLGQ